VAHPQRNGPQLFSKKAHDSIGFQPMCIGDKSKIGQAEARLRQAGLSYKIQAL
jgi:hypothetical protein